MYPRRPVGLEGQIRSRMGYLKVSESDDVLDVFRSRGGGTRTVAGIFQYGDQDFQQALAVTFPLWHVDTQNGLRVSLIDRSVTSAV